MSELTTNQTSTVNDLLRAHVTSYGFVLTLRKTHVAALVQLDMCIRDAKYRRAVVKPDMFITGIHGLVSRGLVTHHFKMGVKHDRGLKPHYTITPAGRLVLALLKEAGMYQNAARESRVA